MVALAVCLIVAGLLLFIFFLEVGWGSDWAAIPVIASYFIMISGVWLLVAKGLILLFKWLWNEFQ